MADPIAALPRVRMIDVFPLNDEVEMMRYRLTLHAPHTLRTIIVESRLTHSGHPKPLHARAALSDDEIQRYNVRLVESAVENITALRAQHSAAVTWQLEVGQRQHVNRAVLEELEALLARQARGEFNGTKLLVHSSDADELLDPAAIDAADVPKCRVPLLRDFYFGIHCGAYYPPWGRSVIYDGAYLKRSGLLLKKDFQMRKKANPECPVTRHPIGWHLGYAMPSERVVKKMRSFAHAHDTFAREFSALDDPAANADWRARECISPRNKSLHSNELLAWDGRLPPLHGWPQHPSAKTYASFSAEQVRVVNGYVLAEERKVFSQYEKAYEKLVERNASVVMGKRWPLPSPRAIAADNSSHGMLLNRSTYWYAWRDHPAQKTTPAASSTCNPKPGSPLDGAWLMVAKLNSLRTKREQLAKWAGGA